jgi:maltose O-acetyltransferase
MLFLRLAKVPAVQRARLTLRRVRAAAELQGLVEAGLQLGQDVFIGTGVFLDPDFCFLLTVEDRVTISNRVTVLAHDATTRHLIGWSRVAPVAIRRGAFVGAGATLLPGVEIGAGAIVAAGSVVRHSVASGVIVAGNPAQPVGDVAAYMERHERLRETRPSWVREGWTASTGITPSRVSEMRQVLAEVGEAYVG